MSPQEASAYNAIISAPVHCQAPKALSLVTYRDSCRLFVKLRAETVSCGDRGQGHPAANFAWKQTKSLMLRTGAAVELSQLAYGSPDPKRFRKQMKSFTFSSGVPDDPSPRGFDDGLGGGPQLYAGGRFLVVARLNGNVWQVLGGPNDVFTLKVFDDGNGDALYAGGIGVAKWNGLSWSPLGAGVTLPAGSAEVHTLAEFDDGNGPALFAGWVFTTAGSTAVTHIAKWNGICWSDPTGGVAPPASTHVLALYPFNDGTGPALYAGGNFSHAGGLLVNSVARWGCAPCRPNCDHSTQPPILNVNDFVCFLTKYAAGDPYANCDGSTTPPTLNVNDFTCFLNLYAAGCS